MHTDCANMSKFNVAVQVKSDRHVDHDVPIEELQQHSVKHIRKEHHEEDVVVESDKK